MGAYQTILKTLAIGVFGVSLIHIILGVGSESVLGANISHTSLLDPNLDSQNRFYGAAFALFGIVWWLGSSNISVYRNLLGASFLLFFVAGLSRIPSIFLVGWPSLPVIVLGCIELGWPWAMYVWLNRVVDS